MIAGNTIKALLKVRNNTSLELEDLSTYANIIAYVVNKTTNEIIQTYSRETKAGYQPISITDNYNYYFWIDSKYTKNAKDGILQVQWYGEIANVDLPSGKEVYIATTDLLPIESKLLINKEI